MIVTINGFKPLWVDKKRCLSYRKGGLYVHSSIKKAPAFFGTLPQTKMQKALSRSRLAERLLRLEPRTAVAIDDERYLVSFCGGIYCADLQNGSLICEHRYREKMNNPLNLCVVENIEGFDDCVVYGEYWGNEDREEVSVYARRNEAWAKAFTFPKGRIQHIHGIVADPYRNCLLILTGDSNDESGIWIAHDDFKSVEPALFGKQRYRSCIAFPVEEGILYATDSPLENNVIALAANGDKGWEESILYKMPGPCIYGTATGKQFVFSTSVEPDSRLTGWRYRLTYRLGQGVKDRYSHIVEGNPADGFKEVCRLKKDVFPMLLFQFGSVQFPAGEMCGDVVMYPMSLSGYDGNTVIIRTNEHKENDEVADPCMNLTR